MTTIEQLTVHLDRITDRLTDAIVRAERETINDAWAEAARLSLGPLSTAWLAKAGHPYAKRAPRRVGAEYPQMINMQTERFASSWRVEAPRAERSGSDVVIRSAVTNNTPYARYLDRGTSLMIRRPFRAAILRKVNRTRKRRLLVAIGRALTKGD